MVRKRRNKGHNIHILLYSFEMDTHHRMPIVGWVLFRVVHMQNLSEPPKQTPFQIPRQGKKVVEVLTMTSKYREQRASGKWLNFTDKEMKIEAT